MERPERIKRASDLYHQLTCLERTFCDLSKASSEAKPHKELLGIRSQMTCVEYQIAILRLIQSENRLRQQLWIAIPSMLGGSVLTFLIQWFSKYYSLLSG